MGPDCKSLDWMQFVFLKSLVNFDLVRAFPLMAVMCQTLPLGRAKLCFLSSVVLTQYDLPALLQVEKRKMASRFIAD